LLCTSVNCGFRGSLGSADKGITKVHGQAARVNVYFPHSAHHQHQEKLRTCSHTQVHLETCDLARPRGLVVWPYGPYLTKWLLEGVAAQGESTERNRRLGSTCM